MSDITRRFIELGQRRFGAAHGWKTAYARSLGMKLQDIRPYLMGNSIPGTILQNRMRAAGFDVEYLNTGMLPSANTVRETQERYTTKLQLAEEEIAKLKQEKAALMRLLSEEAIKSIQKKLGRKI